MKCNKKLKPIEPLKCPEELPGVFNMNSITIDTETNKAYDQFGNYIGVVEICPKCAIIRRTGIDPNCLLDKPE